MEETVFAENITLKWNAVYKSDKLLCINVTTNLTRLFDTMCNLQNRTMASMKNKEDLVQGKRENRSCSLTLSLTLRTKTTPPVFINRGSPFLSLQQHGSFQESPAQADALTLHYRNFPKHLFNGKQQQAVHSLTSQSLPCCLNQSWTIVSLSLFNFNQPFSDYGDRP